ncbi:outer membrane beta-barrel protein [Larkinella sp. VNQ87]|uniref:outer membrane beta-barrel protein n=1 Tax=Larkinella sp. VNQ87 TaxID=3400921 RepID=UPI003C0D01CE
MKRGFPMVRVEANGFALSRFWFSTLQPFTRYIGLPIEYIPKRSSCMHLLSMLYFRKISPGGMVVLLGLIIQQAIGQSQRWSVSLKAGLGLTGVWATQPAWSYLYRNQTEIYRPRLGSLFGTKTSYQLSGHFRLVTGLELQTMTDEFERGGIRISDQQYIQSKWARYHARRLQIPLTLNYLFVARPRSVYVLAGVLPSYLLHMQGKMTDYPGDDQIDRYVFDLDMEPWGLLKRKTPRFQLPLLAGVGGAIGERWQLELTYQYVSKPLEYVRSPYNSMREVPPDVSRLNRSIFLSASYRLGAIR